MAETKGDPLARYLERARRIAQEEFARTHTGSESGEVAGSNINWDDYSLQDLVNLYGGSRFEEATTIFDDDPLVQQFRDQYGEADFDPGAMRFGFDDPTLYGHGADEWMVDPRRVMRTGDGRRIWEGGNVRGDVLARYQSEDDDSGLGDSDAWWRAGVGTVLGVGMLNNYLTAGSLMGGGGVDLGAFGGLAPEEAMGLTSADMVGGASGVGALPEIGGLELLSPEGIAAANPALASAPNIGGGGLLQWAMANPLQAARLGISAASLLSGGAGGRGGGGGSFSIDPTSPLRGNPAGGSTGNTTTNPNAPLDTSAGSPYAPVNTGTEMVMTTQGPMPASSVTGYAGQNAGGEKMAITPEIQNLIRIGNERLNRYRDRFIPLEDLIVDEASSAGGAAMQEERAATAADDVSGQFRRALGAARRNLQRGGINPFSVQGQSIEGDLGREEAAARAAEMNLARRAERDSGFSKRLAAAGIGDKAISQGLSSLSGGVQALLDQDRTAASRENTAASVGAQIAGIQSRERESAADRAQRASEFGEGTRRWDLDFGEGSRRYNLGRGDRRYEFDTRLGFDRDRAVSDDEYRRAGFNAAGEQRSRDNRRSDYRDIGSLLSGVGRFADSDAGQSLWDAVSGWFARGGKVRVKGYAGGGVVEDEELDLEGLQALADDGGQVAGPGTHTSDSIPAMLSDGEYVLPTEAVNIIDQLDPGLLDRIRALGLKVRDMGEQMEQGETFEGDFEEV